MAPMQTIELTDDELKIIHNALRSYLDDFGHDEADLLREIKAASRSCPRAGTTSTSDRPPAPLEPLADSKTTLDELRAQLPELPERRRWISHEPSERFGLISFSGTVSDEIRDLVGKDPEVGEEFEVED